MSGRSFTWSSFTPPERVIRSTSTSNSDLPIARKTLPHQPKTLKNSSIEQSTSKSQDESPTTSRRSTRDRKPVDKRTSTIVQGTTLKSSRAPTQSQSVPMASSKNSESKSKSNSVSLSAPTPARASSTPSTSKREWSTEKPDLIPEKEQTLESLAVKKNKRAKPRPLDITNCESLEHLTPKERILCSDQRFRPAEFLEMKKEILANYKNKNGQMSRRDTRDLFKKDVNKIGKVYDLMKGEGYLAATLRGWQPQDGIGYPGDEYRVMDNVAPASSSKAMSGQNSSREEAQSQAHAKQSVNPSHSTSSEASRAGSLSERQQSSPNDEEVLQADALLSLSRSSTRLSDLSGSPLTSMEEVSFSHDDSSRSINDAGAEADKKEGNQIEAELFQSDPAYGIGMNEEVNELHRINRSRTIGASIDNTIDETSISTSPLRLRLNLGSNFQEEGSLKSNASPHDNSYYQRNNRWKSSSSDLSLGNDSGLESEDISLDDVDPEDLYNDENHHGGRSETWRQEGEGGSNLLQFSDGRVNKKRKVEKEVRTGTQTWSSSPIGLVPSKKKFVSEPTAEASSSSSLKIPAPSIEFNARKPDMKRLSRPTHPDEPSFRAAPSTSASKDQSNFSRKAERSSENQPQSASNAKVGEDDMDLLEVRRSEFSHRLPLQDQLKMKELGYSSMHPSYSFTDRFDESIRSQPMLSLRTSALEDAEEEDEEDGQVGSKRKRRERRQEPSGIRNLDKEKGVEFESNEKENFKNTSRFQFEPLTNSLSTSSLDTNDEGPSFIDQEKPRSSNVGFGF